MNIFWQYLDKRSAAINALKDYNSMLYIIEHTDEEIAGINADMTSIGSPDFSETSGGTHNPQSGEIRTIASIYEKDVLKERYRQAQEYMNWFEPAWDELSDDEKYVLQEFYWQDDRASIANVCEHFNIERSSAYNKKNRAVQHLTLLLYGKS